MASKITGTAKKAWSVGSCGNDRGLWHLQEKNRQAAILAGTRNKSAVQTKKKGGEGASMEDKEAEGSSSNNSRFTQFLDLGQVLDLDSINWKGGLVPRRKDPETW